jgi:hypothetical protein
MFGRQKSRRALPDRGEAISDFHDSYCSVQSSRIDRGLFLEMREETVCLRSSMSLSGVLDVAERQIQLISLLFLSTKLVRAANGRSPQQRQLVFLK